MKKTLSMHHVATSALAVVCAGFIGMSYAAAQTFNPVVTTAPGRVIDITDVDAPPVPDDNLDERGREVAALAQELVREAQKRRVQGPGDNGSTTFPGAF